MSGEVRGVGVVWMVGTSRAGVKVARWVEDRELDLVVL